MPTVLRINGFRVVIFLPPREHAPPHVHVQHATEEAVIALAHGGRAQLLVSVTGLRDADVARAFWIVESHAEYLLDRWTEFHG